MDRYQIIAYVREEMLANKHTSDQFAWDIARLAEINGDAMSLLERWMASTQEEKIFVENLMKDLLDFEE